MYPAPNWLDFVLVRQGFDVVTKRVQDAHQEGPIACVDLGIPLEDSPARGTGASETATKETLPTMNLPTLLSLTTLTLGTAAQAATVYDLSSGAGNWYYPGTSEFGDELHLGGADRIIESFSFDYFANYSLVGGMTFRIYANDGALLGGSHVPGTLLDQRTLDVTAGGGRVVVQYPFDVANTLPNTLTYTVSFAPTLNRPPDTAGLLLSSDAPSVGSSFDDIWRRTGSGPSDWQLLQVTDPNTGLPVAANFKATVTATPEPSTVALLALGGLGMLLAARRGR